MIFRTQVLKFRFNEKNNYVPTNELRNLSTKPRARQSNDNALVESKNGSVVRLGYAPIPERFATQVNAFTQRVLSPYLNFHRPCFFPTEAIDAKGRIRKRYRYELRGHE